MARAARPARAPPRRVLVAQTAAILQYVAPRLGLVPRDEASRLPRAPAPAHDRRPRRRGARHAPPRRRSRSTTRTRSARRRGARALFVRERIPMFLGYLDRALDSNPAGRGRWLVGRGCSYVDLSAFQVVAGLRYAFPRAMRRHERRFPRLAALHDAVAARPADRRLPRLGAPDPVQRERDLPAVPRARSRGARAAAPRTAAGGEEDAPEGEAQRIAIALGAQFGYREEGARGWFGPRCNRPSRDRAPTAPVEARRSLVDPTSLSAPVPNPEVEERMADAVARMRSVFKIPKFRRGQEQVIRAVLSGRDMLAVMPTGSGKSLLYQLTSLVVPGVTVVVSPLIALIKDQLDKMGRKGVPRRAHRLDADGEAAPRGRRARADSPGGKLAAHHARAHGGSRVPRVPARGARAASACRGSSSTRRTASRSGATTSGPRTCRCARRSRTSAARRCSRPPRPRRRTSATTSCSSSACESATDRHDDVRPPEPALRGDHLPRRGREDEDAGARC